MEYRNISEVSDEAIKLQKAQKSRNRIFGLLLSLIIIFFGLLVFEIVMMIV